MSAVFEFILLISLFKKKNLDQSLRDSLQLIDRALAEH